MAADRRIQQLGKHIWKRNGRDDATPPAVRALALICPAGIGRQKNFLLKALPLLLLGSWGKRKMRELVFGPAPRTLPEQMQPLAELMETMGRALTDHDRE